MEIDEDVNKEKKKCEIIKSHNLCASFHLQMKWHLFNKWQFRTKVQTFLSLTELNFTMRRLHTIQLCQEIVQITKMLNKTEQRCMLS